MRMGAAVVLATVAVLGVVAASAGCTVAPRAAGEPFMLPQELAWQFVNTCTQEAGVVDSGIIALSWGSGGASVEFENPTVDTDAVASRIETCLELHRYESNAGISFVSAYERAQLFDYYMRVTSPCLAAHGYAAPVVPREAFFVPDERPWNPYTSMGDIPFTRVLELYTECPPIPDHVLALHQR